MSSLPNAEVCFLLAFPDTRANPPESPGPIRGLKDAPYFQPVDIRVRTLAEREQHEAEGIPVLLTRQIYEQRVQVIEARFSIPELLSAESTQRCEAVQNQLVVELVPDEPRASGM